MPQASDFSTDREQSSSPPSKHASCIPHFDALWFCYSPVHQFKQFYRVGNVDDCLSYWNDLYDCLRQRTKYKDPVVEAEATPHHPLYVLRTPEEAQKFWKAEFGHLESPSAADQPES
ncbi:hypothetical protein WJX77_009282 [Trebouxia sp. C0004]